MTFQHGFFCYLSCLSRRLHLIIRCILITFRMRIPYGLSHECGLNSVSTLLYITVPIHGSYLKRSIALNGFPHRVKLETYFYLCRITWFLDCSKMHERLWLSETFRADREGDS
jgi:hypothetical protein